MYLKFRSKQKLCGEEDEYTTSSFLFFFKKTSPKRNINIIHQH